MLFRLIIPVLCCTVAIKLVQCDVYRLPKTVKPVRYVLTMEPLLSQNRYQGSVTIEIKILESTRNVIFHKKAFDIDYDSIQVVHSSGAEAKLRAASENDVTETYTVHLQNELLKGENYNLTIANFSGNFWYRNGFLLVDYNEGLGRRSLAFSHFEPTGARIAFPCFDEPRLKAKFIVNLIRREGYNSASNEELAKTEDLGDGRFRDTFKETPAMATYAVAFIVSDFKSTEKIGKHRVFAAPKAIERGELDYALKTGVKTLQVLEEFTGINYTLSKLDQFAVPDFPIYAMENWGLVFYRQRFLLHTNESSLEDTQATTCYIAHEFAHQWFGNLVTHEWWSYLWISESFAAFFEYYIASLVQPSWRLMDQFVINRVHKALLAEEFDSAHPLNYPIERIGQYSKLHIMYDKGSAIVRMMEHFLTHDVFRRGIQIYLHNKKFSTAVPSDLYRAFQKAVDDAGVNNLLNNMTVAEILKTWDSRKGFPIVTVTRNYTSGSITLTQFSSVEPPRVIPINYVFSSDNETDFLKTVADYWLTEGNVTINNNFPTDGWILINKQQTGYYRVNYDLENWERLIEFLNSDDFSSIHVLNRAQLIDDAFNLAYNKMIPWHITLRLCEYLTQERDYIPFAAFYKGLENYSSLSALWYPPDAEILAYFENHTIFKNHMPSYNLFKIYSKTMLSGVHDHLVAIRGNGTHLDKLHWDKYLRHLSDKW